MKNTPWPRMAFAALLLTPLLGYAEGSEQEMERARCKSPSGAFDVVIRSPSGQPVEDDMTVWIEREGKSPLHVDFGGQTAWFELELGSSKLPSVCKETLALQMKPGWVLVLLKTDDRPFFEQLSAFVYEPGAHAVRSAVFKFAPFMEPLEVVPGPGAPLFHSTFDVEGRFHCRSQCPQVEGVAVTRMDETALTLWYELRVTEGRLVLRLSLAETRQREGFAPFFKEDRSFGEAIGFDPGKNTVQAASYRLALRADGSKCFSLKGGGSVGEGRWWCTPAFQGKAR